MTAADRLRSAATEIYGYDWARRLAHLLAVDPHQVRRWGNGTRPVPPAVLAVLDYLLTVRADLRDARTGHLRASKGAP
jgi:DNA-binding transcriptional regulator YdaS (Cro superfamily)